MSYINKTASNTEEEDRDTIKIIIDTGIEFVKSPTLMGEYIE